MVDENGCDAEQDNDDIDGSHRCYSRDRPNRGRRRIPIRQPGSAARNQIQPCSDPEATPPTPAANSDFTGGHGAAANGLVAAAAAIAPKSIPKSVRLDVSDSTDSAR